MSEQDLQELRDEIAQCVEDYFDAYDWDAKFKKYLEG